MPDIQTKPSIPANIGRYWWLFLLPAILAIYFFIVFAFVSIGVKTSDALLNAEQGETRQAQNFWLDTAVQLAPWSADAHIARGEHLRAYAITLEYDQRSPILKDALSMFDVAISARPFWPYYQLGALDVEYLLQSPDLVIQHRIDTIFQIAPNERGLDRNLIEVSLLAWQQLRPDQKRSIGQRLRTSDHKTRKQMVALIESLLPSNRTYCDELPWPVIRKICAEK